MFSFVDVLAVVSDVAPFWAYDELVHDRLCQKQHGFVSVDG